MYRILIFHVSSMIWKTLITRHGNQVANSTYTFPTKESQVLSSYGLASQLNPCSLSVWKYFIWFWWDEVCNVCKFPLHQPAKKDKPKIKCPIWCYPPGLHGKLWRIMYFKKMALNEILSCWICLHTGEPSQTKVPYYPSLFLFCPCTVSPCFVPADLALLICP